MIWAYNFLAKSVMLLNGSSWSTYLPSKHLAIYNSKDNSVPTANRFQVMLNRQRRHSHATLCTPSFKQKYFINFVWENTERYYFSLHFLRVWWDDLGWLPDSHPPSCSLTPSLQQDEDKIR